MDHVNRPALNLAEVLVWYGHDPTTVQEVRLTPGRMHVTHVLKLPELTAGSPMYETTHTKEK